MIVEFGVFIVLALAALTVAAGYARSNPTVFPARLLLAAVALRALGAILRHEMIVRLYNGMSDTFGYFWKGERLAAEIWSGGLSPFSVFYWSEMQTMFGSDIWGTPFLIRLSGVVVAIIGTSLRGEFLFFSFAAFLGVFWIALAMHRVQPGPRAVEAAAWIWFLPSVWFWPSAVGKEAVVFFAIGLATLGYVGDGRRMLVPHYLAGVGLAFMVRPHFAAAIALATVLAHWVARAGTWNARRVLEAVFLLALSMVAVNAMGTQLGLESVDVDGIAAMLEARAEATNQGGSAIGTGPSGLLAIPWSFVEVWMRPFPWEATNPQMLMSSLEIYLIWWLVWRRRYGLRVTLRHWRSHRLLQFAGTFLVIYTVMIGMGFSNLGIIARQRAPVIAFFALFPLAVRATSREEHTSRAPAAEAQPARAG